MTTLWAATTKHRHNELFSAILTNQYLPHPYNVPLKDGGVDKKGFQRSTAGKLSAKQMAEL